MRLAIAPAFRQQRQGAGDQPQAQLARRGLQPGQQGPLAGGLGLAEQRQIAAAHGGEVFRQHGQLRAALSGLFEQCPCPRQIGGHVGLTDHLDDCHRAHRYLLLRNAFILTRMGSACAARRLAEQADLRILPGAIDPVFDAGHP
ncbi:hypothetical protein D3C78_1472120 [compost metagenome]